MIVKPADRLKSVGEYWFSKKLEYVNAMRARGIDVINLGIGSPDLVPPPAALEATAFAVQEKTNHGYAAYRSTPELRAAISEFYQTTYRVTTNPSQEVLPLLGSKEGILYLSMALLNPGDQVLIPNPGYPAYSSVAKLIGAEVVEYDLTEAGGWLPDLEKLEAMDLSRCKLMWMNYPHMPTGTRVDTQFYERMVAFAKKKKLFLCNDNPYGLVLNKTAPTSLLNADPTFEVSGELNSLSKSFNMAGWRVGMFLGAKDAVDAMIQVKSNVDSGMFLPVQKGAIAALAAPKSWHEERNSIYEERRKVIYQIFDLLGFTYSKDQVGLFVWAKAPNAITSVEGFTDRVLDDAHVFLTPGFIFGSNGARYARASLCGSIDRLKLALERVQGFKR